MMHDGWYYMIIDWNCYVLWFVIFMIIWYFDVDVYLMDYNMFWFFWCLKCWYMLLLLVYLDFLFVIVMYVII